VLGAVMSVVALVSPLEDVAGVVVGAGGWALVCAGVVAEVVGAGGTLVVAVVVSVGCVSTLEDGVLAQLAANTTPSAPASTVTSLPPVGRDSTGARFKAQYGLLKAPVVGAAARRSSLTVDCGDMPSMDWCSSEAR